MKKLLFIFLVLIMSSCDSDCQKTNKELVYTIDSLSSDNSALKIEVGRYEIILDRLMTCDSFMYEEITKNLE